jgi:predicted N-formylglutamate amidohydrolase
LRSEPGLIVGDNEPYSGKEQIGYTLPHHGESRGIPHVEIEIRQDLIQLPSGQAEWSRRMTAALLAAEQALLRKFS